MAFLSSVDPETVLLSFEADMMVFLRSRLRRYFTEAEISSAVEVSDILKLLIDRGMTMAIIPLPFNVFNIVIGKVPEMAAVENFLICFAFPRGFVPQQIAMTSIHPASEVVMLVPTDLQAKGMSLDEIGNLFVSTPEE
jgi:hypothetical protein